MLPQGLILKINCQGIDNSLRNAKDGFVYFGCEEIAFQVIKEF